MFTIFVIFIIIYFSDAFILSPRNSKNIRINQLHRPKLCSTRCRFTRSNRLYDLNLKSSEQNSVNLNNDEYEGGLKAWLSPNTRGGVLVWSVILTILPVGFYNYLVSTGLEDTKVGVYVGTSFVCLTLVLWASTYIFRVATKDMTYAKQLRDYENAVLQKRLDELADDEIVALMEEIEIEETKAKFDA